MKEEREQIYRIALSEQKRNFYFLFFYTYFELVENKLNFGLAVNKQKRH
jgi:hypothetical protein